MRRRTAEEHAGADKNSARRDHPTRADLVDQAAAGDHAGREDEAGQSIRVLGLGSGPTELGSQGRRKDAPGVEDAQAQVNARTGENLQPGSG